MKLYIHTKKQLKFLILVRKAAYIDLNTRPMPVTYPSHTRSITYPRTWTENLSIQDVFYVFVCFIIKYPIFREINFIFYYYSKERKYWFPCWVYFRAEKSLSGPLMNMMLLWVVRLLRETFRDWKYNLKSRKKTKNNIFDEKLKYIS